MDWTVKTLADHLRPFLVALEHILFEFEQQGGPTIVVNVNGIGVEITVDDTAKALDLVDQLRGGS